MAEKKEKSRSRVFSSGIKRRWLLNNISVTLGAIIIAFVAAAFGLNSYYYTSVQTSLEMRANTTSKYLNRYMSGSYVEFYEYSKQLVQDFSDKDKIEMQIIDQYGRVMFSSTGLTTGFIPATDEVSDALETQKTSTFTGYDVLTAERVMAITAPVIHQNGNQTTAGSSQVIGAVRYVSSLKLLDKQLRSVNLMLAVAAFVLCIVIFISSGFFIRSIVNPVLKINDLAKKITGGQYGARLDAEFNDEIGELCVTMNEMSEELARMEKLKNDFISSVSHELRTPLTAISGWTDTVANDLSDPEIAKTGLNIIQKETQRLSQMVEELLDFSRIESGALKLQTEVFDIRGELYDAVFIYTEMLKQQGLSVEYDEPETKIMVLGDKNRLKQVFLNIIDNAGKYGKDGAKIKLTVAIENNNCVVRIRDFGQGIPANELPFVKEKFFKGSARGRGAGIGLAVCNEIVEMHDGELDIDSVYGEGTEVRVILPIHQPEVI